MKNIFENAYFGKPYKTRDDRKAIFLQFDEIVDPDNFSVQERLAYIYTIQDGEYAVNADDGNTEKEEKYGWDIIGEWKEPISEAELDKLAKSYDIPIYGDGCAYSDEDWDEIQSWVEEAYKAGYRKGLNNL